MQCIDHFTYILENCFGKKKNYFYNNDIAGNVMVQIADTCVVLNIGSSSYCKEDEDGNIWYIKDTGLYEYNINLRSNIRKYNFGHAKPDFIGSQFLPSLTDRNNHVWVGDYSRYDGGNLIEYNGHDFVTYSLETLSGGMPQIGIYSILEDKETGVKYFGLSNGRIAVYNDTSWYFDSLSPAITDQGRYGDVWIDALALDRNNHLIAGMDEPSGLSEGLGIKDSLGWHIINLLPYGSFGLMTNNVLSIKVDTSHGRNDYWIGTKDDGIIIKNDTGYIHLDKWNSPLPDG